MNRSLADLLNPAEVLLLDFDGPVCAVFAGHPAPTVAHELHRLIAARGTQLTADVVDNGGPHDILHAVAELGDAGQTRAVADALRDAECAAVATAVPTPGADDVLRAVHASGRRTVIVSNNATEAIHAYLDWHGLHEHVALVVARHDGMDPRLLKPDPHLILAALTAANATADHAVFLGDSTTDIDAGRRANVPTIGYANKPGKHARLTTAGATIVIDHMSDVATALTAGRQPQHPHAVLDGIT